MPSYLLRGLTIWLPPELVAGKLLEVLSSGQYEHQEAGAILAHLQPGDRFLELGAGLGYLCALAARVVGEAAVTGIEPTSAAVRAAERNLADNGFGNARVIHGAVTADGQGPVELVLRHTFWANALRSTRSWPHDAQIERVPAYSLADLLNIARPTVLCVDIEGAEIDILCQPLPGVRLVVVEFHPRVYGDEGVDKIVAGLEAEGFQPDFRGSKGATVVFRRDPV